MFYYSFPKCSSQPRYFNTVANLGTINFKIKMLIPTFCAHLSELIKHTYPSKSQFWPTELILT